MTDTVRKLHESIIGVITARAYIIAFTFGITRQQPIASKTMFVVTLDRLMDEYRKETS